MVFPKNMRIIFKTISAVVAGIFLWNQIAFAGDLINAALDQQYKDQSQTFAPGYLQNQQSAAESIVSQKQAIEDTVNTQALTASADIPASADETIDLKGPVGGPSSQLAAKTAVAQTVTAEESTPSQDSAVLSVTTKAGDIIHYKYGRIDSIETTDSAGKKITIKRI